MRATLMLIVWLLGGCSFAYVRQPPSTPPASQDADAAQPLTCTRSVAAPVADTFGSLLLLGAGAGVIFLTNYHPEGSSPTNSAGIAAGAAVLLGGIVTAISAGSGYWQTYKCRQLWRELDACNAGNRTACERVGVSPPPAAVARP